MRLKVISFLFLIAFVEIGSCVEKLTTALPNLRNSTLLEKTTNFLRNITELLEKSTLIHNSSTEIPNHSKVTPKINDGGQTTTSSIYECPNNKSLHSKDDLIYLINEFFEIYIDTNVLDNYHSKAVNQRDKYMQRIQQQLKYLQSSPKHLKHVMEGLIEVRKHNIEPKLKDVARLTYEYSGFLDVYNERNDSLTHMMRKFNKYFSMCSINCDAASVDEGHVLFKRSIPDNYYCSSIRDLYHKLKKKLPELIQLLDMELNKLFDEKTEKYRVNIINMAQRLRQNGLHNMSETMFNILILQDEYYHFSEKLRFSPLFGNISTVKNLTIQVDIELYHLSETIEQYGHYCRSCSAELTNKQHTRRTRQADSNDTYKEILDTIIFERLNKTFELVQEDWNHTFNESLVLNDTIKKQLDLAEFEKMNKEVNEMMTEEWIILDMLQSVYSNLKIEDWTTSKQQLTDLLNRIKQLLKEIDKVISM